MQQNIRSNFDVLKAYEPELWRLGALAEQEDLLLNEPASGDAKDTAQGTRA